MSSDGETLITGGFGGFSIIRQWDGSTGDYVDDLADYSVTNLALSTDSNLLLEQVNTWDNSITGILRLRDMDDQRIIAEIEVEAPDYFTSSALLVTDNNTAYVLGINTEYGLSAWRVDLNERNQEFTIDDRAWEIPMHTYWASVFTNPLDNSSVFVSDCWQRRCNLRELTVDDYTVSLGASFETGNRIVRSISMSADGNVMALCADGDIYIRDHVAGETRLFEATCGADDGTTITLNPDGTVLAYRSYRADIVLIDTQTGEELNRWTAVSPNSATWTHVDLAFHPSGNYFVTTSSYGGLSFWGVPADE